MHALPRGHRLDVQDHEAHQGGRRAGRRPRYHASDGQQPRHPSGHHDLRPGRWRSLAGEECDRQVPRRVRRLHPDAPESRLRRDASPGGDRARRFAHSVQRADPRGHHRLVGPERRENARRINHVAQGCFMAIILINGQEFPLPDGEKLNAIQAAQRFGFEIPYYCWHPALSVVANCRMCEIEVGSKDPKTGEIKMIPKMVPACQTPAKDMTVLLTNSAKVKEHQRMIMEYLLINHPLDCPVCDQAGECGLQDFSFAHGQASHRFVEQRNVNPRKDVSDKIQLNQDRCIMCTRCVRFTREISQTSELMVIRRGDHAEIDIFPGLPIDNPLAGNVIDLCPVGALLDKDFLHRQRVWYLSKHDSICTRCSTGCNISSEENRGAVWRFKPRYNPHVNDYWMCDEGRYSYKAANDPALLSSMYARQDGALRPTAVDRALNAAGAALGRIVEQGGIIAGILSPFLTVEEAYLLASYLKGLNAANVLALGPVPVSGADVRFTP